MARFEWSEQFSLQIEEIDRQHGKLVDIINELHEAMLAGDPPPFWRACLSK